MATTVETNFSLLRTVNGMSYEDLKNMIFKHYSKAIDVEKMAKIEQECELSGLGVRNNMVLYMTVINTLGGVNNGFLTELKSRAALKSSGGTKTEREEEVAPVIYDNPSSSEEEDYDLESDPDYAMGVTCNTTRSCMIDMYEDDVFEDTGRYYGYIGTLPTSDSEDSEEEEEDDNSSQAGDVTEQGAADAAVTQTPAETSCPTSKVTLDDEEPAPTKDPLPVKEEPVPAKDSLPAKAEEPLSVKVTVASEQLADVMLSKCVLEDETQPNKKLRRIAVMDD